MFMSENELIIKTPKDLISVINALGVTKAKSFILNDKHINISWIDNSISIPIIDKPQKAEPWKTVPQVYNEMTEQQKKSLHDMDDDAEKELELTGSSLVADLDGLDPKDNEKKYDPDYILNNPPEIDN